jgi:E3 ubiquitin-protein ligase HUWE1
MYDKALQILLLNRFHLKGGLKAILEIVQSIADNLPNVSDEDNNDRDFLLVLTANFKIAFSIIRLFTTVSVIADSPQSGVMTNRDRYKHEGHYFLISAFLTDTRAVCLPVLTNLLSLLNKLNKSIVQPLLSSLCELIIGGPEEFQSDTNKYEGEPDEESIQRIVELGFPRSNAYAALMEHGNAEAPAMQYLTTRRQEIADERNTIPAPSTSAEPVIASTSNAIPSTTWEQVPDLEPVPIIQPAENASQAMDTTTDEPETRMDIDEPNQGTALTSTDKGKGKEVTETRAEALARLRSEFSSNLENYITDILVYHSDLPFELARLIKAVGKWESTEWLQEKMLELAARLASLEDDKSTKAKEITACAHVLGLLLSESRYYNAAEAGIVGFLDSFAGFLTLQEGEETPWMAPVLFILEIVIREVEWRQTRKQYDPKHSKDDVPEIDPVFLPQLLDKLVDILNFDHSNDTVIVCVLRLLVRFTREGRFAQHFREKNGIQSLLQLNHRHAGKTSLKVSDPTIIIIRHVVEDDKIVLATMRSMIQASLDAGLTRGRHIDLSELLRNKYAEVLRNPDLFGRAVEELAKLAGFQSNVPTNRKLTKKESSATDAIKDGSNDSADPNPTNDPKPVTPETPRKSTLELSYSSGVVQLLLTELLSHHTDTITSIKKEESATTDNASPAMPVDSTDAPSPSSTTRTKLTPEENNEYAYSLFLLQTLSELLGSYNNCKLEFVNFSRRGQSREPLTPSKPRSMMLNYLLNDLLPTGAPSSTAHSSQDVNLERKSGISFLVGGVLAALCKKTPESYEHDERPDLLITVRKFVLEGIVRSFKETLSSTGPAQIRYSRYTSLAGLCRKLLGSQMPITMSPLPVDATSSSDLAKLMFEKGFVGLLTNVVADIELDFPDVRTVINDVLGGLRDLTISINRLAEKSTIESGIPTGDIEEISTASSVSEEEEMQDRDETPDVFRNSALGILQGVVDDGQHNHIGRHLDYEEYDEEMDYDDDDDDDEDGIEESGSEDDMDDDGDDDMGVSL